MTAGTYEAEGSIAAAPARRRILLAPFGWYTRLRLRSYGHHAFVVTTALLAIALSIDIAPRLDKIMASAPGAKAIWAATHLLWYMALRSVDFVTRLLPLGIFLGVLWSEVAHTYSRERVMIWNSGRSPLQCIVPVLIFGAITGTLLFVMEAYVRPATVMVQAKSRIGEYGERFDRRLSVERFWIAAGDDLIHARINYGPPPALVDAMIYRHKADGGLVEIVSAHSVVPSGRDGTWILHGGARWPVGGGDGAVGASTAQPQPTEIKSDEITLDVDPLWLSNYRIYAKFLPHDVLATLANAGGGRYATSDYATWLHFRYAELFYSGAMALLAVALALLLLEHTVRVEAVLFISLAGYLGHVSLRACLMLGENGYLAPVIAGWFTPAWVTLAAIIVLCIVKLRSLGWRLARTG